MSDLVPNEPYNREPKLVSQEDVISGLIAQLKAHDKNIIRNVVYSLVEIGESAIPALLSELASDDEYLKDVSIFVLSEMGDVAIPALTQCLAGETNGAIAASIALSSIGVPALPTLLRCLSAENLQVRHLAIAALCTMQPSEHTRDIAGAIMQRMDDESYIVREMAVLSLGRMWEVAHTGLAVKDAYDILIALMLSTQDSEESVREYASNVIDSILENITSNGEGIALLEYADDCELQEIHISKYALDALLNCQYHETSIIRSLAVNAIGGMRGAFQTRQTVDALLEHLQDEQEDNLVRASCANALGRMGAIAQTSKTMKVLSACIHQPDISPLYIMAYQAYRRLGDMPEVLDVDEAYKLVFQTGCPVKVRNDKGVFIIFPPD